MCDSQAETYVGIGVVEVIDIIDYEGLALRPCGVVVLVSLCRKTQYSTVLQWERNLVNWLDLHVCDGVVQEIEML